MQGATMLGMVRVPHARAVMLSAAVLTLVTVRPAKGRVEDQVRVAMKTKRIVNPRYRLYMPPPGAYDTRASPHTIRSIRSG
jgi:hypothetical protein